MEDWRKVRILACRSGEIFARRICKHLEEKYSWKNIGIHVDPKKFSNGEINPIIRETIRNCYAYVVQNIDDPDSGRTPQENFDELYRLIAAARDAVDVAGEVSVIMPNYYGARQHKSKKRESIAARLTADILKVAGASSVLSMDVHDEAIVGYFTDVKFKNLHASEYIIPFLRSNFHDFVNYRIRKDGEEVSGLAVGGPDAGSAKRSRYYAQQLNAGWIIGDKFRDYDKPNKDSVEEIVLLGDIKEKNILVIDDMIDTAGTDKDMCYELKKQGANDILLVCTIPIFSYPAVERLTKLHKEKVISGVIGTDSVIHEIKPEWYYEVSVAPLAGDAVFNIKHGNSVYEREAL